MSSSLKQLWHKLRSPRWFMKSPQLVAVFQCGRFAVADCWFYWGIGFAPADYQQGNSFRIMYVRARSNGGAVALSEHGRCRVRRFSVAYETCRCGHRGFAAPWHWAYCAGAVSGSVWGRPTWGSWWEWDGRTVSTLVLLFLYLGIYALREAIADSNLRADSCVEGKPCGYGNIPVIKYSVDWWNTLHQPASFSLTEKPAMLH